MFKTCFRCRERGFCSIPCEGLNKYLKLYNIHSDSWIRPQVSKEKWKKDGRGRWREIPFSSLGDGILPIEFSDKKGTYNYGE